jgi:uridine kinase
LRGEDGRACIIAIAGPSCSGKTSIARALRGVLGEERCVLLSLDAYYHDLTSLSLEHRARQNFDAPEAIDFALAVRHLARLREGRPVFRPAYDFSTHSRAGGLRVSPAPIVVVEGLLALSSPELAPLYTLRVYVDAPPDVCLKRRLGRDVAERGRTPDSVRRQFDEHVQPMAERWVLPARYSADVLLDGEQRPEDSARRLAAECLHPENNDLLRTTPAKES